MKHFLGVLFFSASAVLVSAQTISFGFADVELEATLNSLNATAKVDLNGFSADLSVQWGVPATEVTVYVSQGLEPAEVYVAAFLAQVSGKPLDTVVTAYKKDKKSGWGAAAKSLGVKPGSAAFKTLKDKSKSSAAKGKGSKK